MMAFDELFFNVDSGYLEGLVRGFRSGILTQSDFLNLAQCETLEGKKAHENFVDTCCESIVTSHPFISLAENRLF